MQFAAYIQQRKPIYLRLMRWDKPVGSFLLLWPTIAALWLASGGIPSMFLVIIFVLGVFVMRAAGCVINDIADRDFDGQVARTRHRPLAQNALSTWEALLLFVVLLMAALGLVLLLPSSCLLVAVCALCVAMVYPWTKRWFPYPQVVLGFAFNAGIIMAYVAVQNTVPMSGWLLYVLAVMWTFGYDTIYAMVDQDDDQFIGIHSSALSLGESLLSVIGVTYGCVFIGLIVLGKMLAMNVWYYTGVLLCGVFFICQMLWIKQKNPKRCFQAFLGNQWAWLIILVSIAVSCLS